MSEDRETPASRAAETPEASAEPGAPVEEAEASRTEVLRAVERSRTAGPEASVPGRPDEGEPAGEDRGDAAAVREAGDAPDPDTTELRRREALAAVDTELDLEAPPARTRVEEAVRVTEIEELPSAGPDPVPAERPARDGEIRISSDHPMAALYMQTPMPPEIRGNRGAGTLIALLATLGFALVYAGVLALWLAPDLAPSQFVDGLLEALVDWGFIAAAAAFLVGLIVLVLVVGRAGWWAYVLGGFLVGALVWAAATAGWAASAEGFGALFERSPASLVERYGLTVPAIAAGIVAREATVWFGAWIGARGRRVKARNAEALAEYEAAMAEVQANRP